MKTCHHGRGKLLGNIKCLKMLRRATSSPNISCGRVRTSSGMGQEKRKDEEPSLSHTFVMFLVEDFLCGCPPITEKYANIIV